jgi:hypothetical protein
MPSPLCSYPHCEPEKLGCQRGNSTLTKCPNYASSASGAEANKIKLPKVGSPDIPWTGSAFGDVSLDFLSATSANRLLAIVGPAASGKTTFLIALYLLLTRGHRVPGYRFAGSFTLTAWEQVAANFRRGTQQRPHFPPHTTVTAGRTSGMLHLALQSAENKRQDLLFTDAPGEWFSNWALEKESSKASGARWIAAHASAFILLLDCDALAGIGGPSALQEAQSLIVRLGQHLDQRPVVVVWSKADIEVPELLLRRLRKTLGEECPGAHEYHVSVQDAALTPAFLTVVAEVLENVLRKSSPLAISVSPESNDPFYKIGQL